MKNTHVCPKCNSTDIFKVRSREDGVVKIGNNIPLGPLKEPILVHRYICCDCGFTEEWVDVYKPDIEKMKKKYK